MEKIEKQCPYCHNNYKRLGTHFYCCEKLKNKTQDEIHLINIKLRSNNKFFEIVFKDIDGVLCLSIY